MRETIYNPNIKQFAFYQLPKWLMENDDISIHASVLYGILMSFVGRDHYAEVSEDYLATKMKMNKRSLQRLTKELRDHKLIYVYRPNRQKRNKYYLRLTPWMPNDPNVPLPDFPELEFPDDYGTDIPDTTKMSSQKNPDTTNLSSRDTTKMSSPIYIQNSLIKTHKIIIKECSKNEQESFDQLYNSYPSQGQTKKKAARELWKKVYEKLDDAGLKNLLDAIAAQKYQKEVKERYKQFVPQWPSIYQWLKDERWTDNTDVDENSLRKAMLQTEKSPVAQQKNTEIERLAKEINRLESDLKGDPYNHMASIWSNNLQNKRRTLDKLQKDQK